MKRTLIYFITIILIVIICGCGYYDIRTEKVVRTYTHNTSNNVSFIIYKEHWQNLTVLKSNTNEIKIIESFYVKKAAANDSSKFIRDYVRFIDNETNLTVYISLMSYVDSYQTKDSNAQIEINMPKNINYTINYVGPDYIFIY
jgi:hypothetical protein